MKKWQPFWSYRIDETEQWLSEMASNGQHLTHLNHFCQFKFEEGTPKKHMYLIDFHSEAEGLARAGWHDVAKNGNWTIYANEQAQRFPSREKILKRLRVHFYILALITAFLAPVLTISFFLFYFLASTNSVYIVIVLFWFLFGGFFAGNWVLFKRLQNLERQYLGIQQMAKSKKAIKKMTFGWFYDPYKTKKWLYDMFEQGYELDRAGNLFFYFVPKQSENISYEIDYEKSVNESYFQLHKEMGWQLKFTTRSTFWNIAIWAMPYQAGEEKPMLTYENEEKMKVLKRMLLFSTTLSLCFLLLMGMNIYITIKTNGLTVFDQFSAGTFSILLNCFVLIIWLTTWFKSVRSYMNEKKLLNVDIV